MNNNRIIELYITGICLGLYYLWKKHHFKYIKQNKNYNPFLEWAFMAYSAIAIFISCISIKIFGNFTTIYIVVPICLGLLYLFRQYDKKILVFIIY